MWDTCVHVCCVSSRRLCIIIILLAALISVLYCACFSDVESYLSCSNIVDLATLQPWKHMKLVRHISVVGAGIHGCWCQARSSQLPSTTRSNCCNWCNWCLWSHSCVLWTKHSTQYNQQDHHTFQNHIAQWRYPTKKKRHLKRPKTEGRISSQLFLCLIGVRGT